MIAPRIDDCRRPPIAGFSGARRMVATILFADPLLPTADFAPVAPGKAWLWSVWLVAVLAGYVAHLLAWW